MHTIDLFFFFFLFFERNNDLLYYDSNAPGHYSNFLIRNLCSAWNNQHTAKLLVAIFLLLLHHFHVVFSLFFFDYRIENNSMVIIKLDDIEYHKCSPCTSSKHNSSGEKLLPQSIFKHFLTAQIFRVCFIKISLCVWASIFLFIRLFHSTELIIVIV